MTARTAAENVVCGLLQVVDGAVAVVSLGLLTPSAHMTFLTWCIERRLHPRP